MAAAGDEGGFHAAAAALPSSAAAAASEEEEAEGRAGERARAPVPSGPDRQQQQPTPLLLATRPPPLFARDVAPLLLDFAGEDLAALIRALGPSLTELSVDRGLDALLGPAFWAALGSAAPAPAAGAGASASASSAPSGPSNPPRPGRSLSVLAVKGIRAPLSALDIEPLGRLTGLEELVLDCDQPPDAEEAEAEAEAPPLLGAGRLSGKWGEREGGSKNNV